MGLGWQMLSSGVISGFDKAIDIGTPIIKNLTQEAGDYVNSPEQYACYFYYLSCSIRILK
jgi:GH25 family lysozyme M1 (1,4-beta-N-acetylmuramidase)